MRKLLQNLVRLGCKIIGKKNAESLLIFCAKAININLHRHGLIQIGALNGFDHESNGELYFIEKVLPTVLQQQTNPVFFDVGANVGDYSIALRRNFAVAKILAFEPVESTFNILKSNTINHQISIYNLGLSDSAGTGVLYNTVTDTNNQIASVYKDVFAEVFNNDSELQPVNFQMDTIDAFCGRNSIDRIDFLKIDVEGHELFVLKGAKNAILNGRIRVIQLEFNTHNLYAKVSLRDFYTLLKGYHFYRLHQRNLVRLGDYIPVNEIFTAQNIIAIHPDTDKLLDSRSVLYYA